MEEETKTNKFLKTYLEEIKRWFSSKKVVDRMLVKSDTQKFWVKNPKKIKFWKKMAENQARNLLTIRNNDSLATVRILKVVYK